MRHEIFSHSNRDQLSLLRQSLKEEQQEVSALFDLRADETDFDHLLKMGALRAHRCRLILQHYALLFQINDRGFSASIASITEAHKNLLLEKSRLSGRIHFRIFSEHIQNCLSIIESLFKGKLDISPKNNLMIRYLNNLKNSLQHLQNMALLTKPGIFLKN